MILESTWEMIEERIVIIIELNPMFNANSQMEFESRDEKNSSYCESMIKCATLAFRFIFLSSMRTRKERATKGKKIITIKLNSRMGQKNSFCCELMIKWRRYVCNVRDAHFYASIFLFLSLSLSLCLSLCAFPCCFSYVGAVVKKRPLLCSLFVTEILAGWLFAAKAELLAEKWNRVSRDASFFRAV